MDNLERCILAEYARDYQDLSACAYKRASRFRDYDLQPAWLVLNAQEDAAELAKMARYYREQLQREETEWTED